MWCRPRAPADCPSMEAQGVMLGKHALPLQHKTPWRMLGSPGPHQLANACATASHTAPEPSVYTVALVVAKRRSTMASRKPASCTRNFKVSCTTDPYTCLMSSTTIQMCCQQKHRNHMKSCGTRRRSTTIKKHATRIAYRVTPLSMLGAECSDYEAQKSP